jgi:GrpB-like predicted nucleotidyltransferase (UPF0157 family)
LIGHDALVGFQRERPTPQRERVVIVDYDPQWPRLFSIVEARVKQALGGCAREVLHVGSTSVPGLGAKPVIDVNVLVDDASDEPSYVPALERAGFVFRVREPEWFEHRLLRGFGPRTNLHIFPVGCRESERMVCFRDWLRRDPHDRALYEKTKRELASNQWPTVQDYADAKSGVVAEIMRRAEASR